MKDRKWIHHIQSNKSFLFPSQESKPLNSAQGFQPISLILLFSDMFDDCCTCFRVWFETFPQSPLETPLFTTSLHFNNLLLYPPRPTLINLCIALTFLSRELVQYDARYLLHPSNPNMRHEYCYVILCSTSLLCVNIIIRWWRRGYGECLRTRVQRRVYTDEGTRQSLAYAWTKREGRGWKDAVQVDCYVLFFFLRYTFGGQHPLRNWWICSAVDCNADTVVAAIMPPWCHGPWTKEHRRDGCFTRNW
jgi:hypothetical protein